MTPKTKNKEI